MFHKYFSLLLFAVILFNELSISQIKTLDDFENNNGWKEFIADGVTLNISSDVGANGNAITFDYDFTKGTGYGGIQKFFPIDLPENFEFTFNVKAESPANNFEIKFNDKDIVYEYICQYLGSKLCGGTVWI